MVDFGNSIFETQVRPEVPIVDPIRDSSSEMFAQGLSSGLSSANQIWNDPSARAAKAAEAKGGVLAEVSEYVNMLSDAREQGKSTDVLNRMLRAKSNEWVSNYPAYADDIFTQINKMTGDNGLAGNINRETPAETGNRQRLEAAAKDGWDITDPDVLKKYDAFQSAGRRLTEVTQQLALDDAEGKLSNSSTKQQAISALHTVVQTGLPWVQSKIATAQNALQGVQDPAQRQAIIDKLKEEVATQTAVIGQLRTASDNAIDTSYLTAGIDGLVKQFEDTASGKSTIDAYKAKSDLVAAQIDAMIMSDPDTAALIQLDKASRFQYAPAIQQLDQAKLDLWAKLKRPTVLTTDGTASGDKPPDIVAAPEEVASIFDELKNSTSNIMKASDATEEEYSAQSNQIVNVLRSVSRYGINDGDAKNFTSTVDFLADPTVGQFIEQHGGDVLPQVADGAQRVIRDEYESVVLPLINERWATATRNLNSPAYNNWNPVTDAGKDVDPAVDVSKIVEPVWNGIGVEFRPTKEYANDPQAAMVARGLNQGKDSVIPAVNKMIRMTAHLQGSTDYKKAYEENYKDRLWITGEKADHSEGTIDQLTNIPEGALKAPERPSDYKETPTSLRGQTGQLLDGIGASEGATYNTLFGYAEQPGGAFAGTDITKLSLNDVQSLQKRMVNSNGISSAVGKYQFLQATLKEAIKGLGLTGNEKFTPALQDKLALWLLRNRTSYDQWVTGEVDPAKFQNELASQWASIPNTSGRSAYSGDGINSASAEGKRLIGLL